MNKPDKIIVHHTAVSRTYPQFSEVDRYHKSREFPRSSLGYYIGYHVLIERDGIVRYPRAISDEGAHCKGQNFTSIGIALAGNFDAEHPSAKQVDKLGITITRLMKLYKIPITRIYPHRRFRPTSCYGKLLSDKWAALTVIRHELNVIRKIILCLQILIMRRKNA